MGVSTDGQLCYGIMFEEGYEFPWGDNEVEAWWRKVNGFKPSFEIYDDKGEYLDGKRPEQAKIDQYHEEMPQWDTANPLPFELVNYCSYDCPMYILAVPGSFVRNSRGYPKEIHPRNLTTNSKQVKALLDFCEKYNIETSEPHTSLLKWYLSSFWG